MLQTFVSRIVSVGNEFQLTLCNRHGIVNIETKSIVLATGCMERTAQQMFIHGSRPAGVMTAGTAQYYANIMGQLPAKNAIMLGSGDIGLVMARRLTLEGARVLGVYEPKRHPDGSLMNVVECLNDFNIPLHFEHTISYVSGAQRLSSVVIYRVDKNLNPLRGSEKLVKCDSLILSVGLNPEKELADSLGVPISKITFGPICDQNYMTLLDGVFCCGNAVHINGLVDYISESGEVAGRSAARYMGRERHLIEITTGKDFLYSVPQYLDFDMLRGETALLFRSNSMRENVVVKVYIDGKDVFSQEFITLRPQKVERIVVNFDSLLSPESRIELKMEGKR
jgi:thioredoxin reductase